MWRRVRLYRRIDRSISSTTIFRMFPACAESEMLSVVVGVSSSRGSSGRRTQFLCIALGFCAVGALCEPQHNNNLTTDIGQLQTTLLSNACECNSTAGSVSYYAIHTNTTNDIYFYIIINACLRSIWRKRPAWFALNCVSLPVNSGCTGTLIRPQRSSRSNYTRCAATKHRCGCKWTHVTLLSMLATKADWCTK